jgi:MFS superfamily sulfate permease-like transporter
MSPLTATALAFVTVLVLMPLFKNLPEAVLAALIIHAVSHLMKVAEFRRYYHLRPLEFWVGLATLLGVITIDVLPGLVIGITAMVLLVVYQASRPHLGVLGQNPEVRGGYGDLGRHPTYQRVPGILIVRLDAPLFYANASVAAEGVKKLVGSSDPIPRAVVLDAGSSADLDITSAETLEALVTALRSANVDVAIAEARKPVVDAGARLGVLETFGDDRVFPTIDAAVSALSFESHSPTNPGPTPA